MKKARQELSYELSDSLIIGLADHFYGLSKIKSNLNKYNDLQIWDIKFFYEKKYLFATKIYNDFIKKFNIDLNESEISIIVIHLLNSHVNNSKVMDSIMNIINSVSKIVRLELNLKKIHPSEIIYSRFISHLKFFSLRIISNKKMKQKNDQKTFYEYIKSSYKSAFEITTKISNFLLDKYSFACNESELTYLTIHIQRLISE